MGESEFYREIVRASGFVRDFYETLKIGTESVIDREVAGSNPVAPTIAVKSRVLTILLNILSIWIGIITH
jgi:hypothetical protein